MQVSLREALAVKAVDRIDRHKHTVYGVRVCGVVSGNGKRYKREALREAKKLYEGVKVCFDHPKGESNARSYGERFGKLFNVRDAADGTGAIDADLLYNPAHPLAEQFLWDAEHNAAGMGLSHNANGNGKRQSDGTILVEQITAVHSVDIVDGPATNYSLYEQEGFDPMQPLTDPNAGGTATGGDVNAQIAAIIADIAAHPEMTKAEKRKKLNQALDLMTDDAHGESAPKEGDSEPSDEEMQEQLREFRSPAVRKAARILLTDSRKRLAAEKGLQGDFVTGLFLEQLCGTDAAGALKLIEDRRAVVNAAKAEKPTTGGAGASGKAAAAQTPKEIAATIDWNN